MPRYSAEVTASAGITVVWLKDAEHDCEVAIAAGELSSMRVRGVELIDRALDFRSPPDGRWRGRAPLLFPAVGRHKDAKYRLADGTERSMGLHGFLTDAMFEIVSVSDSGAGAELDEVHVSVRPTGVGDSGSSTASEAFPFNWGLTVTYTLREGTLSVRHEVAHRSSSPGGAPSRVMPFAIGNHITLRFPFVAPSAGGTARAAWEAGRIGSSLSHELCLGPGSLLTGAVEDRSPLLHAHGGMPLSHPLATNGVLGWSGGGGSSSSSAGGWQGRECTLTVSSGSVSVHLGQWYEGPGPRCSACGADAAAEATEGGGGGVQQQAASHAAGGRSSPCCGARTSTDPHAHRHFVLWGEPPGDGNDAAGFLCPEPWLTGPDSLNTLDGTPLLKEGESAVWTFTVMVTQAQA